MGRVMSLINTTPDGFADGKYAIIDAEFYEFTYGLLANTATIAFGRNTFELFQQRWPAILEDKNATPWHRKMARAMNEKHKAVWSPTLTTTTWNNSTIVPKLDAGYINVYKDKNSEGLLTFGSLKLVEALTAMNLIDDYYFCIQPLIAGNGDIRLFDGTSLTVPCPLTYAGSTQLKSGVQINHYQRVHQPAMHMAAS
jgi:dihydrofolate reductase